MRRFAASCALFASVTLGATVFAQPKPTPPTPPAAAPAPAKPLPLAESLPPEAAKEYADGRILYGDGDNAGALRKFQRAYELGKDPRLLWNVAVCEKNLRNYERVLDVLEQYQAAGGSLLTDADRKEATDLYEAVKGFVSTVEITVNEPGATVRVDGKDVGTTPLPKEIRVSMGSREFRIAKPGFKEYVKREELGGATRVQLNVILEKEIHEGTLVVAAGPKDVIAIDDKVVGTGRWQGILPSGPHRLKVSAPGKRTQETDVVIQDQATRSLHVKLEDAGGGIPAWAMVGGGVLLAAGLGVGGYFLFKPDAEPATPGSLDPGTIQLSFGGGRGGFGGRR